MNKAITFLALFFSFASYSQNQKITADKRFDGLDTAFARVLSDWSCAGFAVAVVEKDKIVYAKGFGYADYENKKRVTENTLFAAGSCTKPFTCALLGILKDEGKIDFNKPVRNYLPELKFYNDDMNAKIRVKDLMTHSTGLPRHDMAWALFKTTSQDTLLQRIQFLEPNYGVREKWQYNNFMFLAQGMIVEKITGESYEQNLRARILQPLGIDNIDFSVDTMAMKKDFSYGYTVDDKGGIQKTDYVNLDVMKPVGGINTSVSEMAKWVMLWINAGKYKGQQVLPAAYISEAISSQMVVSGGVPSRNNPELHFQTYGLGWFQSSYRGHFRVDHGGNISGFSTSMCFFPTDSVGIVIFCNQDVSNNKVSGAVRNLIADRMLKLPYKDWQTYLHGPVKSTKPVSNKPTQIPAENKMAELSRPINNYEGIYTNKGYGSFEVVNEHDSLFVFLTQDVFWLQHTKADNFALIPKAFIGLPEYTNAALKIIFNSNESGDIETASINLEPDLGKRIVFTRSIKPKIIAAALLSNYIGLYDLGPMKAKVTLKNNKGLYLTVPGQPDYELVAEGNDRFSLKGHSEISITFIKDAEGSFNEMQLVQPGVELKGKKIK